jgi:hypothetical protein
MAKQRSGAGPAQASPTGGGLGDLLGGMLGGQASGAGRTSGTGGGLGSMLDLNGDGNPLDDILKMAGKVLR